MLDPQKLAAMVVHERLTPRARKVMLLTTQEGQRSNHPAIRSEHMLLALLRDGESPEMGAAIRILKSLGLDLKELAREGECRLPPGPDPKAFGRLPLTRQGKRVLEFAIQEADGQNQVEVDTSHLLLGLLREPAAVATNVLEEFGVDLDRVRTLAGMIESD